MTSANAAQAEFWGGDPGRRWVTLHDDLEHMHARVADLVLEHADPSAGEHVLDIGCGAGTLSRAAARAVGERGLVSGIDISAPLLEHARALAEEEGLDNLGYVEADAQSFDFGDAMFDLAISRFGTMFFADPAAAFANIRGALLPGGRLVMACWDAAEHNPWFGEAREAAVARLGPGAPADPDAPGPLAFRDPDRVLPILREAGFVEAGVETAETTLHHPGGWKDLRIFLPQIGPIASLMREKDGSPEDLEAILDDIETRWADHLGPDGLTLPARVHLYSAHVER